MNFLPVAIDIENETILIVGGGKVALHKIESIERYTQRIKVIAPEIHKDILHRSFIEVDQKKYAPEDLKGHLLVYAATSDHGLNQKIREDAHAFRCLVNVVDKPSCCDFISPAIYRMGHMSAAFSSNGENVYASIHWRNEFRRLHHSGLVQALQSKSEYRSGGEHNSF